MIRFPSLSFLLTATVLVLTRTQSPRKPEKDMAITRETRIEVVENAMRELKSSYVFPKVADEIGLLLSERLARGEYESITSAIEFARTLTEHVQDVSHDKHMRVRYRAEPIEGEREGGGARGPSPENLERMRGHGAAQNFGFEKLERLPGNVGYLDLRGFQDPRFAGETASAAMNFLANTDALIIDLRQNGGGTPTMVQLICSYLFDAEPVHLNDLYFRPDDRTDQFWTLPFVPGKRYLDKDVYVLTSRTTFSAAEEFTYNLKNLERATIVGETTGGGANPGGSARLSEHFEMFVPSGRAISPVTKTNWEGTGVEPDVKVDGAKALSTAHAMALEKLIEKTTDDRRRETLQEALASVRGNASATAGAR